MARNIRSAQLETRTARLKLAIRKKPHAVRVAPGVRLGYRRNAAAGTWSVIAADGKGGNWVKKFGLADDHEEANGEQVLTFWQAQERARKLARGGRNAEQDDDPGRPVTVGMKVVGALPKEIEFVNEYSAYIPATSAALSRRGRFSLTSPARPRATLSRPPA
jgi:hypothetical protein